MPERREKRARILVVDDDRALVETISDGLADAGYDASSRRSRAGTPSAVLAEDRFDALVTDLRMPGVDGLGAPRAVAPPRARAPGDRDDRLQRRRHRDRVDPPGRVPLPDQALQGRRARALPRPRARGGRSSGARPRRSGGRSASGFALDNVVGRSGGMREVCQTGRRASRTPTCRCSSSARRGPARGSSRGRSTARSAARRAPS